jgi:hypothetical protein
MLDGMERERESLFEWVTRVLRDPDPAAEIARLSARAREVLGESLMPGETVRVLVRGTAGQAIAGTDTRVLVVNPGFAESEAEVSSRRYLDVLGVEVNQRVVGGHVVLRAADGEAVVPAAGDWDVIRARVATLRGLIAGARSDAVPAERHLVAL